MQQDLQPNDNLQKTTLQTPQPTRRLSKAERLRVGEKNHHSLLDDFSTSTVIASTLASVTSFLLSSKIGLAGSLIGVGIAAAASAIASQVYKSLLKASADRLRSISSESVSSETAYVPANRLGEPHSPAETRPLAEPFQPEPYQPEPYRPAGNPARTSHAKRTAAVFAIVCAIVAVLVYAAVVTFATNGQGIGPTAGIVTSEPTAPAEQPTPAPEDASDANTGENVADGKTDATPTTPTEAEEPSQDQPEPSVPTEDAGSQSASNAETPPASTSEDESVLTAPDQSEADAPAGTPHSNPRE